VLAEHCRASRSAAGIGPELKSALSSVVGTDLILALEESEARRCLELCRRHRLVVKYQSWSVFLIQKGGPVVFKWTLGSLNKRLLTVSVAGNNGWK